MEDQKSDSMTAQFNHTNTDGAYHWTNGQMTWDDVTRKYQDAIRQGLDTFPKRENGDPMIGTGTIPSGVFRNSLMAAASLGVHWILEGRFICSP
jgi:hypothetical protein